MEYCPHGNLLEALLEKKRFTEDETRVITSQLLEAIKYCNSKNIVHK
jgi:serine/threonine protein kinase